MCAHNQIHFLWLCPLFFPLRRDSSLEETSDRRSFRLRLGSSSLLLLDFEGRLFFDTDGALRFMPSLLFFRGNGVRDSSLDVDGDLPELFAFGLFTYIDALSSTRPGPLETRETSSRKMSSTLVRFIDKLETSLRTSARSDAKLYTLLSEVSEALVAAFVSV